MTYFQQRHLSLLFQTTVDYHLDRDAPATNLPWTKVAYPSSLILSTKMVLEGDIVALRCRAVGVPKPYLSWVSFGCSLSCCKLELPVMWQYFAFSQFLSSNV